MPYHVEQNGGSCGGSKPWAVIKDSTGETMGCHPSKENANAQLKALYANDPDAERAAAAELRRAVQPPAVRLRAAVPPARRLTTALRPGGVGHADQRAYPPPPA